jgi:hypothetical protein
MLSRSNGSVMGCVSPGGIVLLLLLICSGGSPEAGEPPVPAAAVTILQDSTTVIPFETMLPFRFNRTLAPGERIVDLQVSFLITGSEKILLAGRELEQGRDYNLDSDLGRLELFGQNKGGKLKFTASRRPLTIPRLMARSPLLAWRDLARGAATGVEQGERWQHSGVDDPEPLTGNSIQMGGSKTVVLRMGGGQSLALEQSLRLNLKGWLTDSTSIEAVLRDDDLPFQAEGNTERLEELDKVFLRLQGPAGEALVGDFVYSAPPRKLTPFHRDLKGILGDWRGDHGGIGIWLGKSQGVFRTAEFYAEEGLLGPYELLSALRSSGAVILAGSEVVRLNGRRLTRGRNRDYTIDYDQATLIFTSNVALGAEDIVRVDFRYSQENWRRGAWGAGGQMKLGQVEIDYLHFQEQDDRDAPLSFQMDDSRRSILAGAGDDAELAVTSGVISRPGEGRYVLTGEDPVNPQNNVYTWVDSGGDYDLQFLEVGEGLGNYKPIDISDRGDRIFAHVGQGLGSFLVGEKLQAPTGYRLESLRFEYSGNRIRSDLEVAVSDRDLNLLSDLDDGDNGGLATLATVNGLLGQPGGLDLKANGLYESRSAGFRFPGASSGGEYYRNWNLPLNLVVSRENRFLAGLTWGETGKTGATVAAEGLELGERYSGLQGQVTAGVLWREYHLEGNYAANTSDDSLSGAGRRRRGGVALRLPWPVLRGLDLKREVSSLQQDTNPQEALPEQGGNFTRESAELMLGSRDRGTPWTVNWRESRVFHGGTGHDHLRELQGMLRRSLPAKGRVDLSGQYRQREGSLESEQFQAEGRLMWPIRPGGWGGESLYRLGSRRQRLQQSKLVHVGAGLGDLNEDGIFIGEGEGEYRRLMMMSDEAVRTQNLELEARLVHQESYEGSFWSRLGSETRLRLLEESREDDIWPLARLDTDHFRRPGITINGTLEIRQELRYRLPDSGIDLRYQLATRDNLDGRDLSGERVESEHSNRCRLKRAGAGNSLEINLLQYQRRRRGLTGSGGGNYNSNEIGGTAGWTRHLGKKMSTTFTGGWSRKEDRDRELNLQETVLEPLLALSPLQWIRFSARWKLLHSRYENGDPGADRPWFFAAPGWSRVLFLEVSSQAGANLTLSARYELREDADRPTHHRLRLESRAFF